MFLNLHLFLQRDYNTLIWDPSFPLIPKRYTSEYCFCLPLPFSYIAFSVFTIFNIFSAAFIVSICSFRNILSISQHECFQIISTPLFLLKCSMFLIIYFILNYNNKFQVHILNHKHHIHFQFFSVKHHIVLFADFHKYFSLLSISLYFLGQAFINIVITIVIFLVSV